MRPIMSPYLRIPQEKPTINTCLHLHLTPAEPAAEPKSKLALTIYLPAALRREVEHEAADAGQTLSTYVEGRLSHTSKRRLPPDLGPAWDPNPAPRLVE